MNIFTTQNRKHYRRWVNIIPSLLIPGSSQFLSGKRKRGIIWFIISTFVTSTAILLLFHPESSYDDETFHWFNIIEWTITISLIADACRRPISFNGLKGIGKFFGAFLVLIIAIALPVVTVKLLLFQNFKVPTGAMQPTIMGITSDVDGNEKAGDQILVNKTAYWKQTPQRGDIIVFNAEPYTGRSAYYVKRVVGLPGETVSISPPDILINGNPVTNPEIFVAISSKQDGYHGYTLASADLDGVLKKPTDSITLANDEYFVLGDNSKNSLDSRYFGPIKGSTIVGKAIYIYAPADRKQWIK